MISTYEQAQLNREASERDRVSFAGLVALVMHLFIIFGISFAFPPDEAELSPQIDITLAHRLTQNKPKEADFLGQANQEGGGNQQEELAPSVTQNSLIPTEALNQQEQQIQQQSTQQQERSIIAPTTITDSLRQVVRLDLFNQHRGENSDTLTEENQLPQTEANLDLTLDAREQLNSKYVRTRHISAAIHEARDALYLDNWRRQIERVGNLNYPEEANLRSIYGELVLAVQINHDGTLKKVQIHRSSGHQILDDAAVRIVKLAAPYDPLPEAMRIDTDILEILRTWQFIPGDGFMSRRQ